MLQIAYFVLLTLTVSWLAQLILCTVYARALLQPPLFPALREKRDLESLPKIGVFMPLRGADPFLENAIRSVLENEYPRLEMHIVVDNEQDPAFRIVNEVVSRLKDKNVSVSTLREKLPNCSLVCSSIIQAFETIADRCDIIVFCAADTVVPKHWYWEVAAAMADPEVGCTLGNRWYWPEEGRIGSHVRQLWNMGAAVIMWLCNIPWGGAASLRPADVRRSGLRKDWEGALVEDVTIYNAITRAGLKLRFVPALTNANREEIGLVGSFNFIQRQMMWARMYHPRWYLVVAHALSGLLTVTAPLVLAVVAAIQGQFAVAGWLVGATALYMFGLGLLGVVLDRLMQRQLRMCGEEVTSLTLGRILKIIPAMPLVQVIYPAAVLACCFAKHVDWRGIRYDIIGRGKVRMVEYKPFLEAAAMPTDKTSI